MKKVIIVIGIIILLSVVVIGVLGFVQAQKIKEQAMELQSVTASTLNLAPVREGDFEINTDSWGKYAQAVQSIKDKIIVMNYLPPDLRESLDKFYSEQSQIEVNEAKYLQYLLDGYRHLGLMNETSQESKGQIESILGELSKLQSNLNQTNLQLGPEFDFYTAKMKTDEADFKKYLTQKYEAMSYQSPSVEIKTSPLNKTVEDFRKVLTVSLNDWVDLQNKIQNQILQMSQTSWVNPFAKY